MALTAKKVYAILKRQISDMEAKLNSPVRYRGTVASADLLPLNPDIGDMYNIESKSIYGEAGMNVAWNGVVWDTMGTPIDMSLYFTKEEAEAVIQRLVTEYFEKNPVKPGATAEQAQQIEQNKTDITSLKTETSSLKEDLGNITEQVDCYFYQIPLTVDNKYLKTDGTHSYASNSKTSDFIKVTESNFLNKIYFKLSVFNGVGTVCFYDSNKKFISCVNRDESVLKFLETCVEFPESTEYVKISSWSIDGDYGYAKIPYDITVINEIKSNTEEISEIKSDYKNNLYLKLNNFYEVDFYIDGWLNTNGVLTTSARGVALCTDFISTDNAISVAVNLMNYLGGYHTVFYNENKIMVSGVGNDSEIGNLKVFKGVVDIPENVKYVRFCMWVQGITTQYTPYSKIIYDLNSKKILDSIELLNEEVKPKSVYKYGDSLLKPFVFNGKTISSFGDSITYGVADEGSGNVSSGENSYIRKFASYVNATLKNYAVSGSTITYAEGETTSSIYTKVTTYSDSPDFIIISGGVNDYVTGKPLGEFGDSQITTFYGALNGICSYLKTNLPTTKVIFITPINVTKDFYGHDKVLLNNYRNAIYEVATSYDFNVVNGADLVPVTGQTGYDDTIINHVDGCHPTIKGHGLYAKNLCGKLL